MMREKEIQTVRWQELYTFKQQQQTRCRNSCAGWTRELARLQSGQSDCSAHCNCSPLIGWMLSEKTGTTPRRPPEHQPITTKEILLEFTSASTQTFHSCAKKIVPDKDEMFWSMTATQVTPLLEKCFPFVVRFCSPPKMLPHPDKLIFFLVICLVY